MDGWSCEVQVTKLSWLQWLIGKVSFGLVSMGLGATLMRIYLH
jgi:hypothetical protein